MTTLFMDEFDEFQNNDGKADPGKVNAKLRIIVDEITLAADGAINDEILMSKIPEGARIVDAYIRSDDLGAAGILDFGLKAHTNKAGDAVSEDQDSLVQQADAGGQAVLKRALLGCVGIGLEIGVGGAQPFLKFTEASDAGVGDTIQAVVIYSLA